MKVEYFDFSKKDKARLKKAFNRARFALPPQTNYLEFNFKGDEEHRLAGIASDPHNLMARISIFSLLFTESDDEIVEALIHEFLHFHLSLYSNYVATDPKNEQLAYTAEEQFVITLSNCFWQKLKEVV